MHVGLLGYLSRREPSSNVKSDTCALPTVTSQNVCCEKACSNLVLRSFRLSYVQFLCINFIFLTHSFFLMMRSL